MKIFRNTKGQMRVIETLLASFIIVAALSFVGIFSVSPESPAYDVIDLEKMGYSALHDLDQQELLAPLVYGPEWGDLRTVLKISLPVDVYFNLTIANIDGSKINEILYGDLTTFSEAKNIASISYTLIGFPVQVGNGYVANYDPRILILQLTRG